jgi:hypothetical protein
MRKMAEPQPQPRVRPNPQEYSRKKFEREQQLEAKLKERDSAVYQQLMAQQQRVRLCSCKSCIEMLTF